MAGQVRVVRDGVGMSHSLLVNRSGHPERADRHLQGVEGGNAVALAQLEVSLAQVAATRLLSQQLAQVLDHLGRAGTVGW